MRVLFLAPYHLISDERVLRTLRASEAMGCSNFLAIDHSFFLEAKSSGFLESVESSHMLGSTSLLPLPSVSPNKAVARLQRLLQIPTIVNQANLIMPDLVHVHESGMLGLLLSFWFKQSTCKPTVYFDYHDWIPFELSIFLRHNRLMYRLLLPLLNFCCRQLIKPLDLVITVSKGQAHWIHHNLRYNHTLVIPNVRPSLPKVSYDQSTFEPSVVFIGNVMRCRMLEFILEAIADPRLRSYAPKFHIFGVLSDPQYRDELQQVADSLGVGKSIIFYGSYRSDADIINQLQPGALSYLFPLTFLPNPANVEAISSSNKFFSYATLGLPMLVHASYLDMASTLKAYQAGHAFSSIDGFVLRCVEIWENPSLWFSLSSSASQIAASMNNDVYEPVIQSLYSKRYSRSSAEIYATTSSAC